MRPVPLSSRCAESSWSVGASSSTVARSTGGPSPSARISASRVVPSASARRARSSVLDTPGTVAAARPSRIAATPRLPSAPRNWIKEIISSSPCLAVSGECQHPVDAPRHAIGIVLPQRRRQQAIRQILVTDGPQEPHDRQRSEEHTSELQSLMRISYAVLCLKKKNK